MSGDLYLGNETPWLVPCRRTTLPISPPPDRKRRTFPEPPQVGPQGEARDEPSKPRLSRAGGADLQDFRQPHSGCGRLLGKPFAPSIGLNPATDGIGKPHFLARCSKDRGPE